MSIEIIKTYLKFTDDGFKITEGERVTFKIIDNNTKKGGDIFDTDVDTKSDIFPILYVDKYYDFRNKISLYLGYADHPPQFLHIYNNDSADFTIYGQAYPMEIGKKQMGKIFNNRIGNIPLALLVDPVITTLDNHFIDDVVMLKKGPIYVLSLRDIVSEIRQMEQLNEQNKNIIYSNFISVMFPRTSQNMFNDILDEMDKDDFYNKYRKYFQVYQDLVERYRLEEKIYGQSFRSDKIRITKNILNAKIRRIPKSDYNYNYKLIDTTELFKLLEYDRILTTRLNTVIIDNGQTKRVLFTKINEDRKANALEVIQNNTFNQQDAIEFILVEDHNIDNYVKLTITERMGLSVDFHISPGTKYEKFIPSINKFIREINLLGRRVFDSDIRFTELEQKNIEYFMDIQIIWHNSMSPNNFDKFQKTLYNNLHPNFVEIDSADNKKFYFSKGMVLDTKLIDEKFTVPDYYYDDDKYDDYHHIIKGKTLEISQDISVITFDLTNFLESEANIAMKYIEWMILQFNPVDDALDKPTKLVLKDLKLKDPDLFILKKSGSNIVYSRKCQKNYQPKAYDEIEYRELPPEVKAVATKYWNFTTHKDMYYVCPNKKYPYLSFITGVHPKGYCLPCCRKTNKQNVKIMVGDRKYTLNEYCVKFHSFNLSKDDKEKSRYVIHFGKKINPSRLGRLPPLLDGLINKNLVTDHIAEFSQRVVLDRAVHIVSNNQLVKLIELGKEDRGKITLSYSEFKKINWSLVSPITTDNKIFDIDNFDHDMFFRDNYVSPIAIMFRYEGKDALINPIGMIKAFYTTNSENIEMDVIDLREKPEVFRHRFRYSQVAKSTKKNNEYTFKKTNKFRDLLDEKYYLHGVQQQSPLKHISFINSLAYIIGASTEKMIMHLLNKFRKMDTDLGDIIDYDKDFHDKEDFIKSLMYAMKVDHVSQDYDYSIIIRILFEIVYKINIVVVIYDNNKYSVENYTPIHRLNAIILKKYDYTMTDIDNNITNTVEGKIFYYPIVVTSIKNFINNPNNVRKLFTNDTPFLQHISAHIWDKSNILEFVREVYKNYTIVEDGYRIYIKTEDGYYFYKNVRFSKVHIDLTFNIESIIVCLMRHREWIFSKSTINPRIDDGNTNFVDPMEKKYVPIHSINRIKKIVVHKDRVYYIYLSNDDIVYRINPIKLDTFHKLAKTYKLVFSLDNDGIIVLDYHPDLINSVIQTTPVKSEIMSKISENMVFVWNVLDKNKDIYQKILDIIDIEFDKERRYKQILKILGDKKFDNIPKKIISAIAYDFSLISKSELFREKINMYNFRTGLELGKQNYYYKILRD